LLLAQTIWTTVVTKCTINININIKNLGILPTQKV
jgi:hypothetical protein